MKDKIMTNETMRLRFDTLFKSRKVYNDGSFVRKHYQRDDVHA